MTTATSQPCENQDSCRFCLPSPAEHPADLIDQAQAVLSFLNQMFAETKDDLNLNHKDQYGLCLIIDGVQHHLTCAARQL